MLEKNVPKFLVVGLTFEKHNKVTLIMVLSRFLEHSPQINVEWYYLIIFDNNNNRRKKKKQFDYDSHGTCIMHA